MKRDLCALDKLEYSRCAKYVSEHTFSYCIRCALACALSRLHHSKVHDVEWDREIRRCKLRDAC